MPRPRLPTATKKLKGTLQPCRTNPNEPILPPAVPDADEAMAHLTPEARLFWKNFADILSDMGVLTLADSPALGLLVEAFSDGIRARKTLEKEGYTYVTTNRQGEAIIKTHPCVAQASDADKRFVLLASHFGLTPSARSRVSAAIQSKTEKRI